MKKSIARFCISLVTLCLALSVFCGSAVYAWFAINNVVEQNAMNINVTVTPNLVVVAESDKDKLSSISLSENGSYVVKSVLTNTGLLPCTRYKTLGADKHTPEDTLVYLTNTGDVDIETGKTSGTYAYANVKDSNKSLFYVETTVYVASVGVSMDDYNLFVTIQGSMGDTALGETEQKLFTDNNFNAASVDFLVSSDGKNFTYVDTMNAAHLSASANDEHTANNGFTITGYEIPLNTDTDGCLAIKMLFYYDGSLINPDNHKAFVNTKTVQKIPSKIDIYFEAKAK